MRELQFKDTNLRLSGFVWGGFHLRLRNGESTQTVSCAEKILAIRDACLKIWCFF